MADNNAHPGVRSLLAKFETSQSPLTSPQSRGRSPVGSDSSESVRQGSQVRTNFVSVEEAIGSHHGSPLRKTSGRSGSPAIFGPQINAEEVKARRQNVVSPTPAGNAGQNNNVLDQPAKGAAEGDPNASEQTGKEEAPRAVAHSPKEAVPAAPAAPAQKADPIPNAHASASASAQSKSTEKLAPKTISKRPSSIGASKSNAPSKPASTTPTSMDQKSSSGTTGTKPPSAREAAKERSDAALARKQSRTSLNPAAKTATARMARGSTPSQESSRRSPTSDQSAKARAKSPTRPARIPAAATATTQASAAKLGSAGTSTGSTTGSTARANTAGSTLTRKPSSLKSATGATQTRPSVGSATGVRRQASRPSLPTQSAQERPSSRTSDVGSKPMNEGFLARMMRPTASSASKSHEKSESKPPTKISPPAKAPRQSVGRPAERNTAPPKGKTAAPLRPQSEKSQPPKKEVAPPKEAKPLPEKQDEEKENLEETPSAIPEEPQVQEAIIEEPDLEARATPATDDMKEEETEQVVPQPAAQTAAEPETKTESSTIHNESGAEVDHLTESGSKISAQEDGSVDTGDAPTESNEEASEAPVVPDTKETKETPAPGNQDPIEEEVSFEAKAELLSKDATEDTVEKGIAAESTPAEQNLTEQEALEALKSDEPSVENTPEDKTKTAEISEPVPQAESADKPAEESVPATHFTTENKSSTDDIDFNSLALT